MAEAKKGDKVRIHYTGSLEDGTVFDSTYEGAECETGECEDEGCGCGEETGPMEMTIGAGQFFPQIEEALIGMTPGQKKTVVVAAADAFGDYDNDKVFTVPRSDMPEDLDPQVGDELTISNEEDEEFDVTVVEVNPDSVTFDTNHPLAGEDLTFEIELLEIL